MPNSVKKDSSTIRTRKKIKICTYAFNLMNLKVKRNFEKKGTNKNVNIEIQCDAKRVDISDSSYPTIMNRVCVQREIYGQHDLENLQWFHDNLFFLILTHVKLSFQ